MQCVDSGEGLAYIKKHQASLSTIGIDLPDNRIEKVLRQKVVACRKEGLLLQELGANFVLAEYFVKQLRVENIWREKLAIGRAIHHPNAASVFLDKLSHPAPTTVDSRTRKWLENYAVPLAQYVSGKNDGKLTVVDQETVVGAFVDTLQESKGIDRRFVDYICSSPTYAHGFTTIARHLLPDEPEVHGYALWQALEYYLQILENHCPVYKVLYDELDDESRIGSIGEIYIGRDAYYAYTGRRAQKDVRRLHKEPQPDIHYLVYPKSLRRTQSRTRKRQFLEHAEITDVPNPVLIDTGYAGSVVEDILSTLRLPPNEHNDHIKLLSASEPSRRLKTPYVSRAFVLERMEYHPHSHKTAKKLRLDKASDRVVIDLIPDTPQNQLAATLSKKAVYDYFFHQEMRLHTQPTPKRRIGLYSGTFDPIHIGHIEIAKAAFKVANLDEVWFIVNADPPYKKNLSPFQDRLAMVKLALSGEEKLHAEADIYHEKGNATLSIHTGICKQRTLIPISYKLPAAIR